MSTIHEIFGYGAHAMTSALNWETALNQMARLLRWLFSNRNLPASRHLLGAAPHRRLLMPRPPHAPALPAFIVKKNAKA